MLSRAGERLEELASRVGLGALPAPVALAVVVLGVAALGWTVARWVPLTGPAIVTEAGDAGSIATAAPAGSVVASAPPVCVHVVGAVRRPGVYRLPAGSRAEDALRGAGGALGSADTAALNLARVVQDGEQLVVPVKGQAPQQLSGASPAPGKTAAKVDLNRASAQELDALPGVGPSTAAKIVQEREANGLFRSVEDLMRVPGIGPKKLDALKDLVTAG